MNENFGDAVMDRTMVLTGCACMTAHLTLYYQELKSRNYCLKAKTIILCNWFNDSPIYRDHYTCACRLMSYKYVCDK